MKKVILSGDNVIIKIALKKKIIDLPNGAINTDEKNAYPEIVIFSKRSKEVFPEIKEGSKLIMAKTFDIGKSPLMNKIIGEVDPNEDKNATKAYFLVTIFDIAGTVED